MRIWNVDLRHLFFCCMIAATMLSLGTAAGRSASQSSPTENSEDANRMRSAVRVQGHSPRDDVARWSPTDFAKANPKLPTLVIVGDSTAATGDPTHRGWGAVLIDYFDTNKLNVINRAVGGRSFRTYYGEGAWQKVVDALKPGDFVVIEFGHNDDGSVTSAPYRADLPGIGDQTLEVTSDDGKTETVHTFGWYLRKFITDAKAKGATPIVSSTTVRNIWKDGRVERGMGHMLEWAKQVAGEEKVSFLDHSDITAGLYEKMGEEKVAQFFPADHTHTSTEGAVVNAETFIAGLKPLPEMPLVQFLNDKGRAIPGWQQAPN